MTTARLSEIETRCPGASVIWFASLSTMPGIIFITRGVHLDFVGHADHHLVRHLALVDDKKKRTVSPALTLIFSGVNRILSFIKSGIVRDNFASTGGASALEITDQRFHLGDLLALGFDDAVGQLSDAWIADVGAFAGQDGD